MAGKKVNRLIVPNTYYVDGMTPVTSVNNILPVNGNVTLPIPTVPTNVSAFTNDAGYLTSATLAGYATQSWVQQQGYLTSIPSQYITDSELSTTLADYAQTTDIPSVGNGTITIKQGGVQKGTFTTNQSGNTTIDLDAGGSSGTVDQTYDSTSANAQSGVAIAGAGFLTSIPSNYLQNISGHSYSLCIYGSLASGMASYGHESAVGYYTQAGAYSNAFGWNAQATGSNAVAFGGNCRATGNWAVRMGNNGNAYGNYSIAIGPDATTSASYAIQLGAGTNSTAGSLQVGFGTDKNYTLLSGTTGLIPDARISSNIARASDIPTVPTNISSFTNDSGYITGITSSDVTTALGYTPYNSSNPNGYTSNTGTVTSVNNVAPVDGNVTLSIPTVPTNISAFTNDAGYTTNVGTVTSVNNSQPDASGNVTLSIPTVPTNVSAFTNDSGYITGITSGDVTSALGYTPYNSTNPDEYQTSSDVNTAVTSAISTLLGNLYPVGSVYIGTQSTCPLATLISGSTWQLVAADRVLQGSSTNHSANTTIAAGLPNITSGVLTVGRLASSHSSTTSGALTRVATTKQSAGYNSSTNSYDTTISINASNSNSIYGNSSTVQPPAYVVNIWRRTA